MMAQLKVVSFNMQGLNNPTIRLSILSLLEASSCDVAFLQETHLLKRDLYQLRTHRFPVQLFSSGPKKMEGVAILISSRFKGSVGRKVAEVQGRLVTQERKSVV